MSVKKSTVKVLSRYVLSTMFSGEDSVFWVDDSEVSPILLDAASGVRCIMTTIQIKINNFLLV